MATSGSFDHTVSTSDIIRDALLQVQAIGASQDVPGDMYTDTRRMLNGIVKLWQKKRINIWAQLECYVFVAPTAESYLLGPAATDAEWCTVDDFVGSVTTVASSSGGSTVTVVDDTGMADGDRIGVELYDGTRQWTTIDGAPAANVVTLADALTDDVAIGATIYTYTNRPQRPLRIIHARRRSTYTGSDVPIDIEAHKEYFDQPSKSSSGSMNFVYYKPELISGRLYVWQRPNSVEELLGITVERALADMDNTDDDPDFPIEWQLPLVMNLAKVIEPQYGQLDAGRRAEVRADADRLFLEAQLGDSEMESTYIRPRRFGRR
jgi:hypothetical protein